MSFSPTPPVFVMRPPVTYARSPTNTSFAIPTPPAALRAPVVDDVDSVASVRVTTPSRVAAAPNKGPDTPAPPATIKEPVVLEDDVVVSCTLATPPMFQVFLGTDTTGNLEGTRCSRG